MRDGVKLWKTIHFFNKEIYKGMSSYEVYFTIDEIESHDGNFKLYERIDGEIHYNGKYQLCEKCLNDFKSFDEIIKVIDEYTKDGDAIEVVNTACSGYEGVKRIEYCLRERYKDRFVIDQIELLKNFFDENKDLLDRVCKWLKVNAKNYASEELDTEKMIKELKEAI